MDAIDRVWLCIALSSPFGPVEGSPMIRFGPILGRMVCCSRYTAFYNTNSFLFIFLTGCIVVSEVRLSDGSY
jgi:hypothetical protein